MRGDERRVIGGMSVAQSFRDLIDSVQFEKMDSDWRSIGAMLARMSDRASDFCKYPSDTNYRGTTMEEPLIWSDEIAMSRMELSSQTTDH
jgi:hypothetical protein